MKAHTHRQRDPESHKHQLLHILPSTRHHSQLVWGATISPEVTPNLNYPRNRSKRWISKTTSHWGLHSLKIPVFCKESGGEESKANFIIKTKSIKSTSSSVILIFMSFFLQTWTTSSFPETSVLVKLAELHQTRLPTPTSICYLVIYNFNWFLGPRKHTLRIWNQASISFKLLIIDY